MNKLTVARALTARIGRKAIRLFTFGILIVMAISLGMTVLLVYLFAPWWWLLLIPIMLLVTLALIVRLIALFIVRRVHRGELTHRQSSALDSFIDHVQQLIEARATPPWVFGVITIKDILLHRDITTIKKIIRDSAGLKREYAELEKLF